MAADSQQTCPLCGGDNHCAVAAGEDHSTCWCRDIAMDAAIVQKVPEEDCDKRCICPCCAGLKRGEWH